MDNDKLEEGIAIKAFIEREVTDEYFCSFTINDYGENSWYVEFEQDFYKFNPVCIRVTKLDEEEPEFSMFQIDMSEDCWEEIQSYDHSIANLWKVLLHWR